MKYENNQLVSSYKSKKEILAEKYFKRQNAEYKAKFGNSGKHVVLKDPSQNPFKLAHAVPYHVKTNRSVTPTNQLFSGAGVQTVTDHMLHSLNSSAIGGKVGQGSFRSKLDHNRSSLF